MAEARKPAVFTIPAHRSFADALVAGLMRRAGGDAMVLARGLILLPNNRGVRAVTDAFVRASGGGLLLPRLVALGDPSLDEAVGAAIDRVDDPAPPPPAVGPLQRRMILARLVAETRDVDAGEAVRLAGEVARTLDQLLVEGVSPRALPELKMAPELSEHWASALATFSMVLDRWPAELERIGRIDAATRRIMLLDRLAARWRDAPPAGFVCAAGVSDAAPAVAKLLRCVSELPQGMTVFAGLDLGMPQEEWDALGPVEVGGRMRGIETHPQFQLKQMLDRMDVGRDEVATWRDAGGIDADAARGRAIANAMTPAAFTGRWTELAAADRRLSGVAAVELATPAEEAQAIALALREVLETPGRTGALVTPDRGLARRVAAHLGRWGIDVDDTAGRALSILPPGTMLLELAEAAAQRFAPPALLAVVKHPLVRGGEARLAWLDGARRLDLKLRGPRPAPGLDAVTARLGEGWTAEWWREAAGLLAPVEAAFAGGAQPLAGLVACLREAASALCGDELWAGPAGRAAAELLADLETQAPAGPALVDPQVLPSLLRTLLDEAVVRPPQGGHPRLAIYGAIEARLQTADLMILGGLNEGVWPGSPAPDPWLAPRIRSELGLPGLERRIGVAAHDFAQGLGAPQVMLTRARRDARSPTLASRFWLRLAALSGSGAGDRFAHADALAGWVRSLDDPGEHAPSERPAPMPSADLRPKAISVTEVDRLKADPYAFYAKRILRLTPLEGVDVDPTPARRGNAVHDILELWCKEDGCRIDALRPRALAMLADERTHPMLRALWQPRLLEAIDWIARTIAENEADGRRVMSAEGEGRIEIAGVALRGRYDRIDRLADGGIGIVDYKTGKPPSAAAVRAGFSLQLGLLGVIAERGGFADVAGTAGAFEYWSLGKKGEGFGYVATPVHETGARDRIVTSEFAGIAAANFADAAGKWLTGDDAFTAKLVPEYAPYAEYDQLMRRDEWYGRE